MSNWISRRSVNSLYSVGGRPGDTNEPGAQSDLCSGWRCVMYSRKANPPRRMACAGRRCVAVVGKGNATGIVGMDGHARHTPSPRQGQRQPDRRHGKIGCRPRRRTGNMIPTGAPRKKRIFVPGLACRKSGAQVRREWRCSPWRGSAPRRSMVSRPSHHRERRWGERAEPAAWRCGEREQTRQLVVGVEIYHFISDEGHLRTYAKKGSSIHDVSWLFISHIRMSSVDIQSCVRQVLDCEITTTTHRNTNCIIVDAFIPSPQKKAKATVKG